VYIQPWMRGLHTCAVMPRLTQPSILCGAINKCQLLSRVIVALYMPERDLLISACPSKTVNIKKDYIQARTYFTAICCQCKFSVWCLILCFSSVTSSLNVVLKLLLSFFYNYYFKC